MSRLERAAQVSLVIIASIAVLVALEVGRFVFAPIVLALVVGIVMSPLSDAVSRLGLPAAVAALASLFIILAIFGALALFLEPVVERASRALPRISAEVEALVSSLRDKLRGLEEVKEDAERAMGDGASTGGPDNGDSNPAEALPSVEEALFLAPRIMSQVITFAGALFFFMLTRADIYRFLSERMVAPEHQDETARRLLAAERLVGKYFLTIALINFGYAMVVAAVLMVIGLPSPLLWGIAAGLMNFVIYLGPAIMVVALFLAGLIAFEGWMSLAPAASLLAINLIESQFVTPSLVSRNLRVNALLVFLSLVFFLWLWGPVGGFIAITLILWINVLMTDVRYAGH